MRTKKNSDDAVAYMENIRNAVVSNYSLLMEGGIYFGEEGHLRLARECGYALNDFDNNGQQAILHDSYGAIYVRICNLKPILDAKEWINAMRKGQNSK